ncbi:hypothetical protein HK102_002648, partial [Quaeritorhiza haematococci]
MPGFAAQDTNTIQLVWSWDTCAPREQGRRSPCSQATAATPDIFPRGLSQFILRKNFPGSSLYEEIPLAPNNFSQPQFAVSTNSSNPFFITQLSRFKSDYYSVLIQAQDSFGQTVQGASEYFVIQNTEPLPQVNPVEIVTPAQGSLWLAETFNLPYLIRWRFLNIGAFPDTVSINLIYAENNTQAAQILIDSREYFPDNSTGTTLNATNWVIPAFLGNHRY